MKKLFYFLCVVIISLLLGCSQSSDLQLTPTTPMEGSTFMSSSYEEPYFIDSDYSYKYITITLSETTNRLNVFSEEDVDPYSDDNAIRTSSNQSGIVTGSTLIEILNENVNNGSLEFNNSHVKKAFLGKAAALENMLQQSDKSSAMNKIIHDLIPFSEKWLNDGSTVVSCQILEVLHFFLANEIESGTISFTQASSECNGKWIWIGFAWVCWETWGIKIGIDKDGFSGDLEMGGTVPKG